METPAERRRRESSNLPMRRACLIAGICFLVFTGLQYNDRDAWWWAVMFFSTAVVSFAAWRRPLPALLPAVLGIVCLGVAGWVATQEYLNPGCMIGSDIPGPTLCGLWLLTLAWFQRKKSPQPYSPAAPSVPLP